MAIIRIMGADLKRCAALCFPVADRGQIPILNSVLVSAVGNTTTFHATNTAQEIRVFAATAGEASFCVSAEMLAAKAKTLADTKEVTITVDGGDVRMTQGRTNWRMPALLAGDFPRKKDIQRDTERLPDDFVTNLAVAAGFVDDLRPPLKGVLLDGRRMVATDGHKLCCLDFGGEVAEKVTIPYSAVASICLLGEAGPMWFKRDGFSAHFQNENGAVATQLVDVPYPNWSAVIPTHEHFARLDRAELLESVTRVAAISADSSHKAKYLNMKITVGEDEFRVQTKNSANERGSDGVSCEREGPEMSVVVNAPMMRDVLSSLDADTIYFRYGALGAPMLVEPVVSGRENFRIIMPLNVSTAGFDV